MKSALFAAVALSCALVVGPSGVALNATAGPQRETRERHVYITATDKDGTPVPTLAPADLAIKEDGQAREVLRISPAPPPSHLMLLVDDGAASDGLVPELRLGLGSFLKITSGMEPAPLQALMTFGDRPTMVVPYSQSSLPVSEAAGKLFARPQAGAHFLDALVETAAGLRRAKAERPVIVAFVAEGGPEFSNITHDRVAEALQAAHASLWAVALQPVGVPTSTTEARERAQVLGDIVRDSGGQTRVILNKQGLDNGMRMIGQALSARLDVTYARPDTLIPPKRIEVAAKTRDVRITAPRWAGQ